MFRRRPPYASPLYASTFQFPLNNEQTRDFLAVYGLPHHWRCPECSWEFHVFAQSDVDFEQLIENHERETHHV